MINKKDQDVIDFTIWVQNEAFATYQIEGKYQGLWHNHLPETEVYITSEQLIEYYKQYRNGK